MKISIKQLRTIIREELLKEGFWHIEEPDYDDNKYQDGVHTDDKETLEDLPNDLPDISPLYTRK